MGTRIALTNRYVGKAFAFGRLKKKTRLRRTCMVSFFSYSSFDSITYSSGYDVEILSASARHARQARHWLGLCTQTHPHQTCHVNRADAPLSGFRKARLHSVTHRKRDATRCTMMWARWLVGGFCFVGITQQGCVRSFAVNRPKHQSAFLTWRFVGPHHHRVATVQYVNGLGRLYAMAGVTQLVTPNWCATRRRHQLCM